MHTVVQGYEFEDLLIHDRLKCLDVMVTNCVGKAKRVTFDILVMKKKQHYPH